ncbi:MAG: hypothetical protein QM757_21395 [Paludibaculum sp.]
MYETARLGQGIAAAAGAMTLRTVIAVALVAQLSIGYAASPAIGVAVTKGSFQMDSAGVAGTGTIFDGSMVETGKASSELKLQSGVRMTLDSGTRGQIYEKYLVLEKGTGQLTNAANYVVKARSLQIEPSSSGSAKITVSRDDNRVLVAALGSGVRVRNMQGILVADVPAGRALSFEQQGGASAPSTLSGTITKRDGHYYLTDTTAGITVELVGKDLDKNNGKKVKVVGMVDPSATAAAGATQVVRVSSVSTLGSAGAVGAATGMTVGTKAVIAGVVVAGIATGTAVGVTRDEKPPISQ